MIKYNKPTTLVRLGDFFEFLDEHEALTAFLLNMEKDKNPVKFSELNTFHPKMWVSCAFMWDETPENHKFWEQLDEEWCKLINSDKAEVIRVYDLLEHTKGLHKVEVSQK